MKPQPQLNDPLSSLMQGMSLLAAGLGGGGAAANLLGQAPGAAQGPTARVQTVLLQAQAAASAALLRGMQRGAQSWAEYAKAVNPAATAGVAGATAAERQPGGPDDMHALALSVDEARAQLRRLTEIAADEARLLEQQLRGLDEALRAVLEVPAAEHPRRRARGKV